MIRALKIAAAALVALATPVAAEIELSFYLGMQEAPHSRVEGDVGGTPVSFLATWEGRSFEAPPHYGFRATWWRTENLGYGVDFNHAKVYADDTTLTANGFARLELTDGLNIITGNVMYRWPGQWASGRLTPYVGAGLGISVPHVDVTSGSNVTFGYQFTGPAATWIVGTSWAINETWSVFGEYKGTYSVNSMDLDGGGTLETNIVTNALNFGVSYKF